MSWYMSRMYSIRIHPRKSNFHLQFPSLIFIVIHRKMGDENFSENYYVRLSFWKHQQTISQKNI